MPIALRTLSQAVVYRMAALPGLVQSRTRAGRRNGARPLYRKLSRHKIDPLANLLFRAGRIAARAAGEPIPLPLADVRKAEVKMRLRARKAMLVRLGQISPTSPEGLTLLNDIRQIENGR